MATPMSSVRSAKGQAPEQGANGFQVVLNRKQAARARRERVKHDREVAAKQKAQVAALHARVKQQAPKPAPLKQPWEKTARGGQPSQEKRRRQRKAVAARPAPNVRTLGAFLEALLPQATQPSTTSSQKKWSPAHSKRIERRRLERDLEALRVFKTEDPSLYSEHRKDVDEEESQMVARLERLEPQSQIGSIYAPPKVRGNTKTREGQSVASHLKAGSHGTGAGDGTARGAATKPSVTPIVSGGASGATAARKGRGHRGRGRSNSSTSKGVKPAPAPVAVNNGKKVPTPMSERFWPHGSRLSNGKRQFRALSLRSVMVGPDSPSTPRPGLAWRGTSPRTLGAGELLSDPVDAASLVAALGRKARSQQALKKSRYDYYPDDDWMRHHDAPAWSEAGAKLLKTPVVIPMPTPVAGWAVPSKAAAPSRRPRARPPNHPPPPPPAGAWLAVVKGQGACQRPRQAVPPKGAPPAAPKATIPKVALAAPVPAVVPTAEALAAADPKKSATSIGLSPMPSTTSVAVGTRGKPREPELSSPIVRQLKRDHPVGKLNKFIDRVGGVMFGARRVHFAGVQHTICEDRAVGSPAPPKAVLPPNALQVGVNGPALQVPNRDVRGKQARSPYAPRELTAHLRRYAMYEKRDVQLRRRLKNVALAYILDRDTSMYTGPDVTNHMARAIAAAMIPCQGEEEARDMLSGKAARKALARAHDEAQGVHKKAGWRIWPIWKRPANELPGKPVAH